MNVVLSKTALKALRRLDRRTHDRVVEALRGLEPRPPQGDVAQLKGVSNHFRLRVGALRILFTYQGENASPYVYVTDIGVRGDVYK